MIEYTPLEKMLATALLHEFNYIDEMGDCCVHCGEDSCDFEYENHNGMEHEGGCPVLISMKILGLPK